MLEVKGLTSVQMSLACAWHEPFVLHYERSAPIGSPYKLAGGKDAQNKYFTVELFLPEIVQSKGKSGEVNVHQIGKKQSF